MLQYRLGISLFHDSVRCSCGAVFGGHGNHILGCGDGPLRICQHDAICDLLCHAWSKTIVVIKRNSVVVLTWIIPGMS